MSLRALAICLSSALLAGCSAMPKPASIKGECKVFTDPGRAVKGATATDQRWISKTQEAGIASCGWERPKQ